MADEHPRTVWSRTTERRVTIVVLTSVALLILLVVVAYWSLRG